jgi:hypothetical protein
VIWAVLFPISFWLFEPDPTRKKILRLFIIPGILVAIYFLIFLIFRSMETMAVNHHVFYQQDFPKDLVPYAAGFYLTATAIPPLLSTDVKIKWIGFILISSYLIARVFFQPSLISIWCFFAIAVSILILLVLRNTNAKPLSTL